MTERSSVKPFVMDFINDARSLKEFYSSDNMTDKEILSTLLDDNSEELLEEDHLVTELFSKIKPSASMNLATWFKLTER